MAEEIPKVKISFVEMGSIAEGIIATLFRESDATQSRKSDSTL
jgi:hypothetical protein